MRIILEQTVLNVESRTSFYFTIVRYNKELLLYSNDFNLHKGNFLRTRLFKSRNGIDFMNPIDVFKGNALCHNFHPFVGMDKKLYGIGGMYSWKNQDIWHKAGDFDEFKKLYRDEFGKEYDRDEKRFQKAHDRLVNEIWVLEYSDGLYLFESEDGRNWRVKQKIVVPASWGFHSSLEWKGSEFDGHICCINDGKEYYLYLRDNVKMGTRFIQVAKSENLLSWDEFKPITIDPEFNPDTDNYYFPSFFRTKNKWFGLLPYYSSQEAHIAICESSNGIDWKVQKKWLSGMPMKHDDNFKNYHHPVNGIIESKGLIYFYVHHNYMGINEKSKVYIKRYSIDKNEL